MHHWLNKPLFLCLFVLMSAFVRNDGLPLGSLSKYTWHITNLMQVKRIFDTPEVNTQIKLLNCFSCYCALRASLSLSTSPSALQLPLELSQSFVRNADGSYSPFRCPDPPPEPEGYRPQAIRPMELRTFLKVGEWQL